MSLDDGFAWPADDRGPDRGWRVAWLGDLGGYLPVEPGVLELCAAALERSQAGGFRVEPNVPGFDFAALWQAFVTLRHATSGAALKLHYDNPHQRNLLKPETVWEIEGALALTAPEIHDASVVRSSWYKAVTGLFERYDLLALPSAQVFAFAVETHWPDEIAGRKMDSYHRWMEVTALATMAGCPVANVPVGFDQRGRSMGMQLIGRPRADAEVLSAAQTYEQTLAVAGGA
jgi:amidase